MPLTRLLGAVMKTILFLSLVTFNAFAADLSDIYQFDKKTYAPAVEQCRKITFTVDKNECLEKQVSLLKPTKPITNQCGKIAQLKKQPSNSAYTMFLLCQLNNPSQDLSK
jgi:hypothetical protein